MEGTKLSLRTVGITLVLSTLMLIIMRNIEWTISLNAYFSGKVTVDEYEKYYEITKTSSFFLLNLIIVCFLVAYFAINMKNDDKKVLKVGFYSSIVSLVIQISNIVLYACFIVADPYAIFSNKPLLITIFILGIAYTVGFIIPLICLWKLVYDSYDKRILKILSCALLLYGVFTLIYAFQAVDVLFFSTPYPSSIELRLTYNFFDNVMTMMFDAIAVLAGSMMIIRNET
ncbi:MAG: hypothetical protein KGD64_11020 [Candidatus Heimdallarchaeota archaeon]|nr:hypothetical protein [Candidatus Heimdallarchaeota archaeon]